MLSSVEQAFVGREEIRTPLKTPAWEAIIDQELLGLIKTNVSLKTRETGENV